MPLLLDDADLQGLKPAVERSIGALGSLKEDTPFDLCGQSYSVQSLRKSLQLFAKGLEKAASPAELQRFLFDNFTVCRAAGGDGSGEMLVTGYYEPLFWAV